MFQTVAIVVYSCLATATFNDFNPHTLDAAKHYVASHPELCMAEPPLILDAEVTLEQCRSRAMLGFMPGWLKQHPDRVWLGARCEEHQPADIIMGPAKDQKAGP